MPPIACKQSSSSSFISLDTMATAVKLPTYGCEHLDDKIVAKVRGVRSKGGDLGLVQYNCLDCPTSGGFSSLDSHFKKSKHQFAASSRAIFCGPCNDLVYDPDLTFNGAKKRRKLAQPEPNEEDEAYLAANTTARPCGREGVRGLFNLGETCYMNAVLQMMVHNPLLACYFLVWGHPFNLCPISNHPDKKNDSDSEDDDDNEDKEQKTCVACGMTEVFSDATQADQSLPAHAVNLLFASWKNIPVSTSLNYTVSTCLTHPAHVR